MSFLQLRTDDIQRHLQRLKHAELSSHHTSGPGSSSWPSASAALPNTQPSSAAASAGATPQPFVPGRPGDHPSGSINASTTPAPLPTPDRSSPLAHISTEALRQEGSGSLRPPTPADSIVAGNQPRMDDPYADTSSAVRPRRPLGTFDMESRAEPAELPMGTLPIGPTATAMGASPSAYYGAADGDARSVGTDPRSLAGYSQDRRGTAGYYSSFSPRHTPSPSRTAGTFDGGASTVGAAGPLHSSPPWYPPGSSVRRVTSPGSTRRRSPSPPRGVAGLASEMPAGCSPASGAQQQWRQYDDSSSGALAPSISDSDAAAAVLKPTRYRTPYLTMLHDMKAEAAKRSSVGGFSAATGSSGSHLLTQQGMRAQHHQHSPHAAAAAVSLVPRGATVMHPTATGAGYTGDIPRGAGLAMPFSPTRSVKAPTAASSKVSPMSGPPSPSRSLPMFMPSGVGPAIPHAD